MNRRYCPHDVTLNVRCGWGEKFFRWSPKLKRLADNFSSPNSLSLPFSSLPLSLFPCLHNFSFSRPLLLSLHLKLFFESRGRGWFQNFSKPESLWEQTLQTDGVTVCVPWLDTGMPDVNADRIKISWYVSCLHGAPPYFKIRVTTWHKIERGRFSMDINIASFLFS